MFKLIVVGGKLRGQEYILKPGDNVLGRDQGCDIHFQVDGVSKRHITLTVSDDAVYVQDMGSANGTFLNGKLIKRATIKSGDKVGLPNGILQLVKVQEKKLSLRKKLLQPKKSVKKVLMTYLMGEHHLKI